ncbi:hypothetical protein HDU83_000453 [Entophlyctis luteolus]|nr:hypothetical protein HDU83_000453 [Entophlyctis luteolus]
MASRSKTVVFLQFRATFARRAPSAPQQSRHARNKLRGGSDDNDNEEVAGLIRSAAAEAGNDDPDSVVVEMDTLPPKWVDIVDEVDDDIAKIKLKISDLEALHKKHLLPGFGDDRIVNEQSIERLTDQITSMFRNAQRSIKKIETETNSATTQQSAAFGRNIQMCLAQKLQDASGLFRKSQSSYLQKLRGRETRSNDLFKTNIAAKATAAAADEDDDEDLDAVFTDAQMAAMQDNERAISEREREINQIVKSINGLAEIFKELQTMVIDQGTVLDRIDYNIENTAIFMQDAHVQLEKVGYVFQGLV